MTVCGQVVSDWLCVVRWFTESARWLVLNQRSEEALKSIQRVARINGKKDANITLEVPVCLSACVSVCVSACLSV